MAMSPMMKWQKSNERAKVASQKAKQRRRDIQDLKDRGMWVPPDVLYRDEYGYIKFDAPQWFKNLSKAHKSNDEIRKINDKLKAEGLAPVKRKRKKKTLERKPRKVKVKRSVEIQNLLYEQHGITVIPGEPIADFAGFTFLIGGRIRTPENDVISTIQFIHDYV